MLRTWELKMLRRMLKLRPRPEEGRQQFNTRTATLIRKWCSDAGVVPLYTRVIRSVYKAAWSTSRFQVDCGDSPLQAARNFRDQLWWATCSFLTPAAKRRREGVAHRRVGAPIGGWEQPFVAVWGQHWKEKLNHVGEISEWMRNSTDFLQSLCLSLMELAFI